MTITAAKIPPEVVEALKNSIRNQSITGWAENAIAAALAAWPGAYTDDETMYGKVIGQTLFLPLSTEPSKD